MRDRGRARPTHRLPRQRRGGRPAPGLFALILFSTLNNLIGGVYMALMDPYGLTLFPVEWWGIVLGVTATGFIIGGVVIAKFGLGRNPIRTMLLVVIVMGVLGALFTIREWWWLYAVGIWAYMCDHPGGRGVRADRRSRRSCRSATQGRVFGFAAAFESAAAPSRRSSSRPSRSSGSSRTWSPRPARRRGAGSSATARPAASRSCSSSAGCSWSCSRCSPSRRGRIGCCPRSIRRHRSDEATSRRRRSAAPGIPEDGDADQDDVGRAMPRARTPSLSGRSARRRARARVGFMRADPLTADIVAAALRDVLRLDQVLSDPADSTRYAHDDAEWARVPPSARRRARRVDGRCRRRRAVRRRAASAVVPRGAGTGLSGGANALAGVDRALARAHDAHRRGRRRTSAYVVAEAGRHQRRPAPGGRRSRASGIRPTRRATGSRRSAATSPRTRAASAASSTA